MHSRVSAALALLAAFSLVFIGRASAETKRGLVIVAPSAFHASLGEFVEHKKKKLPVELASLEKVLASSEGADDAEKLKRFLYAAWKERSAGYVLLVGDADVLPVRYMVLDRVTAPAFDYAFYPSDLYYSDLAKKDGTFEDWNFQKEGFHATYYGEVRGEKNKKDPINFDAIDYLPEIAVGRWPVSRPEEVALVAKKTMTYEKTPNDLACRRAGFFVVDGWVDARPLFTDLSKKASLPDGWVAERRFYGEKRPPTEAEVEKLLSDGLGLVVHAGHGSDDSWAGCFSLATLARVDNKRALPVMISAGCSTARFATLPPYEAYVDVSGKVHNGTNAGEVFQEPPPAPACYQRGVHNPTGLGEQLLRKGEAGAVAYIGCNTGSQPCGLTLVEGFVTAWKDSERLGDAWSRAIAHYHSKEKLATIVPDDGWYPASIYFQGMKFMLFGDPSLELPGKSRKKIYR